MPARTNKPLRYRQIHLDFHTSEHIPGSARLLIRRTSSAHSRPPTWIR